MSFGGFIDLFNVVHEQMGMVRLLSVAIIVTATRRPNTPLVVILHRHGLRHASPLVLPGVDIPSYSAPGSAIQLTYVWQNVEAVDEALLDAAWQLGAWGLERVERCSCNVVDASTGEALACRQAFGDYEGASVDEAPIDGAPDRAQLMQTTANEGYLCWLFRFVKGGVWQALREPDDTLGPDSEREPPCPVLPIPRQVPRHRPVYSRTVYCPGAVRRILLP